MNNDRRAFLRRSSGLVLVAPWAMSPLVAHAAEDGVAKDSTGKDWPARPIRLIVPNVPGGGIDILGRLLQAELTKRWKQPVVIDYKPGAGTVIGTDVVARAPGDGYTLGMVVTSHVINPSLRKNMPFDTLNDLAGVGMTATSGILLSSSTKLPIRTLADLIAYGQANQGKLTYATPGAGSAMHLAGEQLKLVTGIQMLHVAYKGSGGAYVDVMDGRVDLLIDPLFASLPHVAGGKLKPIAVMSSTRDPAAPTVPAAGETLPDFDVRSINGLVAPKSTPRMLVERISADVAAVLKGDALKAHLKELGLEPVGSSPEAFDSYVRKEVARWAKVVNAAHVSID